jgi:uncharacterized protein with FMN-binding domain
MPVFVSAQTKPANATAQCKDGTYSTAKTRRGACSQHGGVTTWFGAEEATKSPAGKAPTAASRRPANATGQCQDGSYTTAATKQGACSRHGGVTTWFADSAARERSNPPPRSTAGETAPAPVPATPRPPKPTTSTAEHPANATAKCKDGTFSFAAQHRGACSHHGGVAEWYK